MFELPNLNQHLMDALIALDPWAIAAYRLFEDPVAGFYAGTAVLALVCAFLGELMMALVWLANKGHYMRQTAEMVRMHNLSVAAIEVRDKDSYKAANTLANDWFGKNFFSQIALFSVSVWPAPFALAWMATRFETVDIPVPFSHLFGGLTLGYTGAFVILYIVARVAFAKTKHRLPFFSRVSRLVRESAPKEDMRSWGELMPGKEAA